MSSDGYHVAVLCYGELAVSFASCARMPLLLRLAATTTTTTTRTTTAVTLPEGTVFPCVLALGMQR
jgi:hypothetical protein